MNEFEMLEPITPGEILSGDFLEPLGISISRFSRDLSVPPNAISEIVNGKRSITANTALRLETIFWCGGPVLVESAGRIWAP
jgi:antitoxin HigA-1